MARAILFFFRNQSFSRERPSRVSRFVTGMANDAKVDIIIDAPEQSAGQAGETGEGSERLLRARGAAARAANPPATASPPAGDVEEDDPPDDSQSPFVVWMGLLMRTLLSALHTAFSAMLFALYPIYVLVPTSVLEGLFRVVLPLPLPQEAPMHMP